jgi:hypothetical protein
MDTCYDCRKLSGVRTAVVHVHEPVDFVIVEHLGSGTAAGVARREIASRFTVVCDDPDLGVDDAERTPGLLLGVYPWLIDLEPVAMARERLLYVHAIKRRQN